MGNVIEGLGLALAGAIHTVIPEQELPGVVQSGADFHDSSGPESVVEEFFGTVPDHLDRFARDLGQTRCFHGLSGSAFAAEAAPYVRSDDPHVFRCEADGLRELLAD